MTKEITTEKVTDDLRYLQLLARCFPTIADASTEIINLEAILNLPKGTEHFLSDIHGEYQAFSHVLRNASGSIKRKIGEIFNSTMRDSEKKELCTLIYYPEEKLVLVKSVEKDLNDWYMITLNHLVKVCRNISSKYTRSKVRKALPREFSYIIQELLHESSAEPNKSAYVDQIIRTIISTGRADDFIIAICNLIQRLTIDQLHIIGDIYDRGPGAHLIMDTLCDYHNVDIQWGNHDILWMGAAAGNWGSIANVVRMSLRYGNLSTLEDGYGINLLPLATFAMDAYTDALAAEDDSERDRLMKAHAQSVRKHIDELAEKDYSKLVEDAIGFVLMFIPNETSYIAAMRQQPELSRYAYQKKIIIISPSNLLMALQLAYNLWQYDRQNKNVEKIVKTAADLYDKVAVFEDTFTSIGDLITRLSGTFDKAKKQLYDGAGNVMRRVESLKELGVTPKKQLKALEK